jgi:DNA-directed RNA polymerase subunit F
MAEGGDGKRLVPLTRVKDLLQREGKKRELSLAQKSALEHASAFSALSEKEAVKTIQKLKELEHVDDATAIKIVDTMPKSASEVGAIFAKERFTLSKDEVEAILDILSSVE